MSLRTLLKTDRYAKTIIAEAIRDSEGDPRVLRKILKEEFPGENINELMAELE